MDVSPLQEKSTFPVLTMRMSPRLEPFFYLIYDCILHKCCAISNQYHFMNPISTFLPKFQEGSGPPVPPSGSAHALILFQNRSLKALVEDGVEPHRKIALEQHLHDEGR